MKAQLVLALCLVAIVACSVVAEEAELQAHGHGHTHVRKVAYNKTDYYGDYHNNDGPYPHKPLDCSRPKTWPSLWKEKLVCVNITSGLKVDTCTGTLDSNGFTKTTTYVCVPVGDDFCKFGYRTTVCRQKNGQCDKAENCPGTDYVCPSDGFEPNTTRCEWTPPKSYGGYSIPTTGPCVDPPPGNCTGNSRRCPGPTPKRHGTPCNENGVYQEAYTKDGELATLAAVPAEHAEPHWAKCKRCYMGKCVHFKYQWWKTIKEPKHKHHEPSKSYYSYDYKPYKPEGDDPEPEYKDYHEDSYEHKHGYKHKSHNKEYTEDNEPDYEEEYAKIEVYPTKAAIADYDDGYQGYEPDFWCSD